MLNGISNEVKTVFIFACDFDTTIIKKNSVF